MVTTNNMASDSWHTYLEQYILVSDKEAKDALVSEGVEGRVEDICGERSQHAAEENHPA